MVDILNHGALNIAMAIGYRTGIFEAMDVFDGPQTLPVIAEKSGLNQRYVKEWLGIMVTGGGALLAGISRRLAHETGMPIRIAYDPLYSVVIGSGRALENIDAMRDIAGGRMSGFVASAESGRRLFCHRHVNSPACSLARAISQWVPR